MSPTYDRTDRFDRDWDRLGEAQRARFRQAVGKFLADLAIGGFRKSLRVKRVEGAGAVFELTYAPDGRATWEYGEQVVEGEPHVVWRRIGTHEVFRRP